MRIVDRVSTIGTIIMMIANLVNFSVTGKFS